MPEKPKLVENSEYWQFTYKKNPQPARTGRIRARDERTAVKVAEKWCYLNNCRFIGGSVTPDILADESILKVDTNPIDIEPSMEAIQATTSD